MYSSVETTEWDRDRRQSRCGIIECGTSSSASLTPSHSLSLTLTFTSSPYTLYYTLDQRTYQEYSELGALTYIHPSYE
jgi:hypothetical protein